MTRSLHHTLHRIGVFLAVLLSISPQARAESDGGFAAPAPSLLAQLRHDHDPRHWLRITTTSTRLEARVRDIRDDGLSGLELRREVGPPPPELLPWSSISRIDSRHSRQRLGQITGLAVGGAIGAVVGGGVASDMGILPGAALCGFLGFKLGGGIGDRIVTERPLYVALPAALPDSRPAAAAIPAVPSADSTVVAASSSDPDPGAAARISRSPGVRRAIRRIGPEDLMRVRGDFGRFQGFATVGPQGIEGARVDVGDAHYSSPSVPAGPITWDRIDNIDIRGNSWRRGALMGGVSMGILGGLAVGAFAGGFAEEQDRAATFAGGFVYGGAVTGALGAVVGGLIGATVTGWHNVYDGP